MAQLTGETLIEAVINTLRERLEREQGKDRSIESLIQDVMDTAATVPRCRCSTGVRPTKFSAVTRMVFRGDH